MKQAIVLTSVLLGSGFLVFNTSPSSPGEFKKLSKRANAAEGPSGNVSIVIDKSDYELRVYDNEGWYATYPVVFGSNDLNDKYMEGDRRTPEGKFRILLKKIHPKWGPELLLDYPNEESIKNYTIAFE